MLDLEFDQEQELLRQTVRDVLQRHCSLDVVRAMEDDPVGYPPELWSQFGQLDLIGLLLPEEYGGSGMSLLEGVALYEELGRALAPTPHFVSAVMAGGVLAAAGSDEQKERWLRSVAAGEAVLTPAWLEPENGFSARGVEMRAASTGGGFSLSGLKRHVAFASSADRLVVLARTGEGDEDVDLFLVDPSSPGVTLRQQFSIASDTQYEVAFSEVALTAADRIGAAGSGWDTWQSVLEPALVLLAAQAVGGARYTLEITTQYAKDRQQFNKPLGRVPGTGALPRRRRHRPRRGGAVGPRSGVGGSDRPFLVVAGTHGQALRLLDVPGHHGDGAADLRWHRVHAGLRHPALLQAGQGTAADVGERSGARGVGGGRAVGLSDGPSSALREDPVYGPQNALRVGSTVHTASSMAVSSAFST